MKSLAILVILAALVYVSANILPPVYDGPTYELTMIEESKTNDDDDGVQNLAPIRHRRVTCDLLSFQSKWLSFNDSACAAKCLAQRRRGGRCSNGICVCRS